MENFTSFLHSEVTWNVAHNFVYVITLVLSCMSIAMKFPVDVLFEAVY